jgi:hypothetical protein
MEPLLAVILTRATERIMVVCAGILSIYVGYRLFTLVPERKESEGRVKLPGGASFFFSKVGPGVFFALFGTGLIGYSATQPVSFNQSGDNLQGGMAVASGDGGGVFVGFDTRRPMTGALTRPPPGSADRPAVIGYLNAWFADLPADTPSGVRIDRRIAVTEAKLALMREVWDPAAWGDYDAFHRWVTVSAGSGPPPAGTEQAAALFTGAGP